MRAAMNVNDYALWQSQSCAQSNEVEEAIKIDPLPAILAPGLASISLIETCLL